MLNTVNMAANNRRFDSQLSDIRFRQSGITRPLDLFLHQTLQQEQISTSDTIEVINFLHALFDLLNRSQRQAHHNNTHGWSQKS
jgi:hypothetical protein